MPEIHPQAIVDAAATLAENVRVDAFAQIGPDVTLDSGVHIRSHVVVDGITHIGAGTVVYPFAVIGMPPQDLKYRGEKSSIEIGQRCQIRESVTIHPGTADDKMKTIIGNDCLLMVGAHVAHDCCLGDNIIMANNAILGGHVSVDDGAIIGGHSAILQQVRVGKHAMVSGLAGVTNDVPPFAQVFGCRATIHNINLIGMKRSGYTREEIKEVDALYKSLFFEDSELCLRDRAQAALDNNSDLLTTEIVNFVLAKSKKCICTVCEKPS